ncbi:MAG: signal recognition particle protein [Pseudomonadota bacterium]
MFESLSDRLNLVFKKLRGQGKLTEQNIKEGLREVRLALLEADVNYKVTKDFIAQVSERAVGSDVLGSLTPGQQIVKIVNEELTALMGGQSSGLNLVGKPPIVLMLVGLHGCGKTTSCAKLARHLKTACGRRPLLAPADVYRPAAIDQLESLARQAGLDCYAESRNAKPVDIAVAARAEALRRGLDTLIIDTAGRLQIDEPLMEELRLIKEAVSPSEILLVADAMAGQDAVNVAKRFNELLDVDGIILTKMEGDARGGAALSIKATVGKPIKFIGVGEKLDALEVFHPDRVASRILGMGDVLTLIEKAQATIDTEKALELREKLKNDTFTLDDFREQLRQVRKIGSLGDIMAMVPGLSKLADMTKLQPDDRDLVRVDAIIGSMTAAERQDAAIINGSRRRRIALGSGANVQDVNLLLKNYNDVRKMMKLLGKGKMKKLRRGMFPFR